MAKEEGDLDKTLPRGGGGGWLITQGSKFRGSVKGWGGGRMGRKDGRQSCFLFENP